MLMSCGNRLACSYQALTEGQNVSCSPWLQQSWQGGSLSQKQQHRRGAPFPSQEDWVTSVWAAKSAWVKDSHKVQIKNPSPWKKVCDMAWIPRKVHHLLTEATQGSNLKHLHLVYSINYLTKRSNNIPNNTANPAQPFQMPGGKLEDRVSTSE